MKIRTKEIIIFNLLHKWRYLLAIFYAKTFLKKPENEVKKIRFIAREKDKDWIFGAKVRRLSKLSSFDAQPYFHDKLKNFPDADGYYFIYQNYFCRSIRSNPKIINRKNVVMFTHPTWTSKYSKTHVAWCLNKADAVICLNSKVREDLIYLGVAAEKLKVIHIASDPDFFQPHERKTGSIGFCSTFSERKNPELVYQLIKNLPEKHFYIIGRHWEQFDKYNELKELPNFTYFNNEDYSKYPELYSKIDIFISTSKLEGGPVPVLEAMLSNCLPITSRTGFCPDIIEHGVNGFLFDTNANYQEVIKLIRQAEEIKIDVRKTALEHSWQNSARKIDQLFLT